MTAKLERRFVFGGMTAIVSAEIGTGLAVVTFEGARMATIPVTDVNAFRAFMSNVTESTEMLGWMSKLLPVLDDTFRDEGEISQGSGVPVGLVRGVAQELQALGRAENVEMPNFMWRRKVG